MGRKRDVKLDIYLVLKRLDEQDKRTIKSAYEIAGLINCSVSHGYKIYYAMMNLGLLREDHAIDQIKKLDYYEQFDPLYLKAYEEDKKRRGVV